MCLKDKDKGERKANATRLRRTGSVAAPRSIFQSDEIKVPSVAVCDTTTTLSGGVFFFSPPYNTRLIKTANIELSLSDSDCRGHDVDVQLLSPRRNVGVSR